MILELLHLTYWVLTPVELPEGPHHLRIEVYSPTLGQKVYQSVLANTKLPD